MIAGALKMTAIGIFEVDGRERKGIILEGEKADIQVSALLFGQPVEVAPFGMRGLLAAAITLMDTMDAPQAEWDKVIAESRKLLGVA